MSKLKSIMTLKFSNSAKSNSRGCFMTLTTLVYLIWISSTSGCTYANQYENLPNMSLASNQIIASNTNVSPAGERPPSLSKSVMLKLLTAEMAINRHQPGLALQQYYEAAVESQLPMIIHEATQLAIELKETKLAIKLSKLWAQSDPENLKAHLVAATLLIGQNIYQAYPYLVKSLAIAPDSMHKHLTAIQYKLSLSSRHKLMKLLTKMADEHDKNPYAQFIAGQSAAQLGDISEATSRVQQSLSLKPDLTESIELNAKLIRFKTQSDDKALAYLKQQLSKYANDMALRMFLTSALLDNHYTKEAQIHLKKLITHDEYQSKASILLAEIYTQDKQYSKAATLLEAITEDEIYGDPAKFLLGEIAEKNKDTSSAIHWYSEVYSSDKHIIAFQRAARLLAKTQQYNKAISLLRHSQPMSISEQKSIILTEIDILSQSSNFEEAIEVANRALRLMPNDIDFLYARSLVRVMLKQHLEVERDLLSILKINPNHADALNALGYTLAIQGGRMNEAMNYLSKAIELSPNNPAFIDSMGWLHYQMGNLPEALDWLKRARKLSNDTDIAVHLGEVLWMSGHKQDAKKLWVEALKLEPEHPNLKQTLDRLDIELEH